MNNVSHGVAARDGRGKGGTKEEIRVGYAQDYEGGDISREEYGRKRKSPRKREPVVKECMRRKINISRNIDFRIHVKNK